MIYPRTATFNSSIIYNSTSWGLQESLPTLTQLRSRHSFLCMPSDCGRKSKRTNVDTGRTGKLHTERSKRSKATVLNTAPSSHLYPCTTPNITRDCTISNFNIALTFALMWGGIVGLWHKHHLIQNKSDFRRKQEKQYCNIQEYFFSVTN